MIGLCSFSLSISSDFVKYSRCKIKNLVSTHCGSKQPVALTISCTGIPVPSMFNLPSGNKSCGDIWFFNEFDIEAYHYDRNVSPKTYYKSIGSIPVCRKVINHTITYFYVASFTYTFFDLAGLTQIKHSPLFARSSEVDLRLKRVSLTNLTSSNFKHECLPLNLILQRDMFCLH